ncbi:leucine-rich repeat-containing protein 74A isoform X2 [Kryptolebias marmoratus]|uniref:leucine-rich repeat-containing protein 74A isoform X2 n=1 Tax=Kryptolebias marmoratus TaxID=37003 RepID=UPI0018ACA282|nr:leucine-rich repeat-containing protein 74A isoform X2 [Kryptolebias marmoratus]
MEKQTKEGEEKPSELLSNEERDMDLEADDAAAETATSLRAEVYLKACRWLGAAPVSSFLRDSGAAALNLNSYGVGRLGAEALALALKHDCVVAHLELEDNGLDADGTRCLMKMLQENNTVRSLVNDHALKLSSSSPLSCLLTNPRVSSLQNLSNNHLGPRGAGVVSKMLSDNYNVTSLKLSGNNFDDSAAKCLSEALKGDFVVKELDLSNNSFSEAGGELLAQMLGSNMGIELLNLSWNPFRLGAAAALSAALKVNSTLTRLRLSHCGLGRAEAQSLAQALKQNSTLALLDLSWNCLDDPAVAPLCQGLSTNGTLGVLKLCGNPVTSLGALALLRAVKANTNSAVEELDISNVFVCETFVELLREVRCQRPSLNVHYSVLSSVTRNTSALNTFKEFLKERSETLASFFQALDEGKTLTVSTSDFRRAVKEVKAPLDEQQLDWLVRRFDKNCTATIKYSHIC